MKTLINKILLILLVASLGGCASSTTKKINEDLVKEPNIVSRESLEAEMDTAEMMLTDITLEQKAKIDALKEQTKEQLSFLRQESMKLRSLLIKNVFSETPNLNEQKQLMKRIRSSENKRLSTMFEAVGKANKILGHEAPKNRAPVERMFDRLDRG